SSFVGDVGIGTITPNKKFVIKASAIGENLWGTEFSDGDQAMNLTVDSAGASINLFNVSAVRTLSIDSVAPSTPAANTLYPDNICKGWINFDGQNTIAIRDSFNVSGITDRGTGYYQITWNTDFADVNYAVSISATQGTGAGVNMASCGIHPTSSLYLVGSMRIVTEWANNVGNAVRFDRDIICVTAFGNQ
ncbi:hypothetical protein LCGC14_2459840, partial [marine sediment metagenome]